MVFEIAITEPDRAKANPRFQRMEAQADRVEAKLGRYTSRYETILATITRLLHDMDRVSDSNCGREIFQTLKRQIACMSDSLNKQMVHIRACQKKLVGTVDAGAHLNDWCIAAFRQAILANQMAIRVKRCSGRASKTLILLTEAAHLERQQQVETHSSASTLLDLYKKLGGELALAVGNIEAFDKAERKFGELLDSVLGSQEMDEEDRDRPDDVELRVFVLKVVSIEPPEWDMEEEVEEEEDYESE